MTVDYVLADFTKGMQKLIGAQTDLDATIKIVFEDETVLFIDGKSVPHTVSNRDEEADVTLRMTFKTLNRLYRRELHPAMAVMRGKIQLEGDLVQALKLEKVLQPFAGSE